LAKERILFDPIVLSLGAGNDPFNTLKAIDHLKKEGLFSVCGLSNLSFGLPDRTFYNASFLSMAIERGVNAAIMNPEDAVLMGVMGTSLVVSGRKEMPKADVGERKGMIKLLLNGNEKEAVEFAGKMADEKGPMEALEQDLKPAMEAVGELYSKGRIFLPQLIMAAQTSRPCFDRIEELLPKGSGKDTFLIATVKGDIHDIGKNIAAAIIRSSGFDVVDLGKDVSCEKIVKEVKERIPIALGLSAMMTTTAGRIKEVVEGLEKEGVRVKVIAGGASLNEKVVKELGADLYVKDPVQALDYLKNLQKQ
jgi:5-methyltetrahydrofolate--homocysteine methyltransferase